MVLLVMGLKYLTDYSSLKIPNLSTIHNKSNPENEHPGITIKGKFLYIFKKNNTVNIIVAKKFKPTIRKKIFFLIKSLV